MTATTYIASVPVPFDGTDEERAANRETHFFISFDPDEGQRCSGCDCRPSHVAADYPCGENPPRATVKQTVPTTRYASVNTTRLGRVGR